jgi:hypothetical protein
VAEDGSLVTGRGSLPFSLPPRLVDAAVVVVPGQLYAGYVTANVVKLHAAHGVVVLSGAPASAGATSSLASRSRWTGAGVPLGLCPVGAP